MRTLNEIMGNYSEPEFVVRCSDYKFFCENVLGLDIQPFHLEWIEMIKTNKRVAIVAPTGFGKTEVLGRAFCLWTAYTEESKEMCIVSKTLPQARKVLAEIRECIENNELLEEELIPKGKKHTWASADAMTLATACKIFVRPYSENIRGIHVDFLLGDEVATYNEHSIWNSFVVTRVNAKDGTVVAISTPKSISDLMQGLLNNSEYVGKAYPAIVDGKSIWGSKFPIERLARIKAEIGVAAFEREYLVNPKAEVENALYPPHLLIECFDFQSGFTQLPLPGFTIIGADFAIASGPRADYDAYVVLNKFGRKATILHGETHRGFMIAAKVNRLVELYNKYKYRIEDDQAEDVVPGTIRFVVDPSSVGQAVFDELRSRGLPVEAAKFDSSSRNQMLINLRQMIENKDLVIPRNKEDPLCMTFTDKMVKELISMVETQTKTRLITYQSKAAHDDTVMALAMAAKGVNQQREFVGMIAF